MAGLPLWTVDLPFPCSNEEYESLIAVVCERAVREGFHGMAFGESVSGGHPGLPGGEAGRDGAGAGVSIVGDFDGSAGGGVDDGGWSAGSADVCRSEEGSGRVCRAGAGIRALLSYEGSRHLRGEWEFDSFHWAGPMFEEEIRVAAGERVERDGFGRCGSTATPLLPEWCGGCG